MILKALYDYYHRCGNLPTPGLEEKEIGYLIVIREDGSFVRIENRMINKNTAQTFLVPQTVKRSGQKFIPNYFWDKYEYIIGGKDGNKDKHQSFVDMVQQFQKELPHNEEVHAVCEFFKKYENLETILSRDSLFSEVKKTKKVISFLLNGNLRIIAENEEIKSLLAKSNEISPIMGTCLITGKHSEIARLHTSIGLTKDTGPLVAFKDGRGYDSYGKEQGFNAPVCKEAEFAYTTALNALQGKDSHNKFMVGNRTFLFWSSSTNNAAEQAEESLFDLLGISTSADDNPNARIEQVKKVFASIYTGSLKTNLNDRFYILGLAPNSARIAVVYWSETLLKDFAEMVLRHFHDMEIVCTRKDQKPYMGIHDMLSAVTLKGKQSEVIPNLPEAVIKSIFQGTAYPYTLFSACIHRIRAETSRKDAISVGRIAILKAYLNRTNNNEQKISVMLNKDYTNQGYLCGRLFAVLDKVQEDANGISSIRERYMNAASATPVSVFATILNLSSHHMENLKNTGSKVFYAKLKQEIIGKISASGFPARLDLQDQGRFFIGYYHQRQDLFMKKEEKDND